MNSFKHWWLARVTFERLTNQSRFLPDNCQGASGWMACSDADGQGIRDKIADSLYAVNLRPLEIGEIRQVSSIEDIREIDEHLAHNVLDLESGKSVVWGTVHAYKADGEA